VVETSLPVDGRLECRDRNEQILVAACGRAARCFHAIRLLAGEENRLGEDAFVLCRTLFSIAVHSLYLTHDDDLEVRRARLDAWVVSFLVRLRSQEEQLATWNLQQEDLDALQAHLRRFEDRRASEIERVGFVNSVARICRGIVPETGGLTSGSDGVPSRWRRTLHPSR
jgi:hypothetical protein